MSYIKFKSYILKKHEQTLKYDTMQCYFQTVYTHKLLSFLLFITILNGSDSFVYYRSVESIETNIGKKCKKYISQNK